MSGRIRTVKPELNQLPWFATLSDAAARTYFGLLGVVDDLGRCAADPLFIAGAIFWGRQRSAAAIGRQLAELERAGIIRRYRSKGGEYLEVLGWDDKGGPLYQQVNKPQGEKFPAPESFGDRPKAGPTDGLQTGTEGKGREGKGREDPSRVRDPAVPSPAPDQQPAPLPTELPEIAGDRALKPANVIQQPPAPILPAAIARAEIRRLVIGQAWQIAGDAFRELGSEGIEPTAPDAWAGMPSATSEGMKLCIARVDELLIGDEPSPEPVLTVIRRRVAVAAAEGRAAMPRTRRWLTPMRIWNAESFAKGAENSPEQVRPRAGPRSSAGRAATKRDVRYGQIQPGDPSNYDVPDGEMPL